LPSPRFCQGFMAAGLFLATVTHTVAAPPFPLLPGPTGAGTTRLHNGWSISPAGIHHEIMGDLLLGGVISPNGKWLAFVNGGAADHQVHIADTENGKVIQSQPIDRAQSTGGVAFSPDGNSLYVSGGNAGCISVFSVGGDGTLTAAPSLVLPGLKSALPRKANPATDPGRDPMRQDRIEENAYLGGLAVSPDGKTLYIANVAGDSVFSIDVTTGAIGVERKLEGYDRPGAVTVAPDGKTVYVALWGRSSVLALDPATLETRATFPSGSHPNALLLTQDGARLFVSCGNDDSVDSFETDSGAMSERINMRMTPRAPAGATPSALALSPDQKSLYVVNSDNNDVAVVDVAIPGRSRVEGFIPTTWYPTIVAASHDGKRLFIGCGKGFGTTRNDATRPIDPVKPEGTPYIVALLKGVLSTVPVPDAMQLAHYTRQVYANSPYQDGLMDTPAQAPKSGSNPIPSKIGDPSPIKHVLYIIKENRTYDQVLGDLKDAHGRQHGNGAPALALFGEQVSPNHHALSRQFVTLDNLYANGEVSVDGHHWSNGAYVPDAMQRMWPSEYGGKGGTPIRYGDFGDPLAETPNGRIWDLCERAGVSFKTYYYHVDKRRSDEWAAARKAGVRDYQAVDIYTRDLATWEKTGDMPGFMVMALSEDHTVGTQSGKHTPIACVASNDLGIGKIVEACSKSRFWKQMAIFIIEDDAQNGPDHVDAHRTVGLVVSPYVRHGTVDSTFYSTCSFLRTMELILGLPPMSQYDAAATPLYASFTSKPDTTPYVCLPETVDMDAVNTKATYGAAASLAMDLSEPDHLTIQDEDTLNRVLWHDVKGPDVPYPGTVRRPLFDAFGRSIAASPQQTDDDDDDDDKRTVRPAATHNRSWNRHAAKPHHDDDDDH
jgi:YVTN family beta-propeller protein